MKKEYNQPQAAMYKFQLEDIMQGGMPGGWGGGTLGSPVH